MCFPDDATQADIDAVTIPISREFARLQSGGLRTYPSHYQPVSPLRLSDSTQQAILDHFERA